MNKQKSKALAQLASMLPATYIRRPHTEHATLSRLYQLIDDGHDIQGLPELTEDNADTMHSIKYEATEIINHHKRLKAAWKAKGTAGIQEYIRWVDQNNRRWSSQHVERVDPALLEIARAKVSSFWKMLMLWIAGFAKFFTENQKKVSNNT